MIRVFILEDSATIRRLLNEIFGGEEDFEVVGQAATVEAALPAIHKLRPDLVSLDVFLPDGTAADVVRRILAVAPIPIVLLSEAKRDADEVFEALAAGALDFMRKPKSASRKQNLPLLNAMRALSRVKVELRPQALEIERPPPSKYSVVTIASSTGGPNALRELLAVIPETFPLPIVIAQHVAEGFEAGLIRWLGQTSRLSFKVALDRTSLKPGEVVLGRSGWDLVISRRDETVPLVAPVRGYHPSGDTLFTSAVKQYGAGVLAVVLSGIGSDGTAGALDVARVGGVVLAQDEGSCVVYGMPASAARSGAVSVVGSPTELGHAILRFVDGGLGAPSRRTRSDRSISR